MSKLTITSSWPNSLLVSPNFPAVPANGSIDVDAVEWKKEVENNTVLAKWLEGDILKVSKYDPKPEPKSKEKETGK